MGAVRVREASASRKLSPLTYEVDRRGRRRPVPTAPFCSSTYASIAATCSDGCPFKRDPVTGELGGCFAEAGFTGHLVRNLDRGAVELGLSGVDVALEEVRALERAFGYGPIPQDGYRGRGRDLRIHVSGDVADAESARLLGQAATAWKKRRGGTVWTYTHTWRQIPREAFGPDLQVLASCETREAVRHARVRGYAPALVVSQFRSERAYESGGLRILPCPAETRGVTCVECRLCLDRDLLDLDLVIGFAIHGSARKRAEAALEAAA